MSSSRSNKTYIIDDSVWYTPSLALSAGWNMINSTSTYFISQEEVEEMKPHIGDFWEGSYSWNTHKGCSNTITFVGTSIKAYGLASPSSGDYSVVLDNTSGRLMSAYQEKVEYQYTLFEVDGLNEGEHTLTFTNLGDGKWFGFDYAEISSIPTTQNTSEKNEVSRPQVQAQAAAPPDNFTLPQGLLLPAEMLSSGRPTVSQLALLTPYEPHWTPGAYFTVFVTGIALACLYVFFLFQFAGVLRNKAGSTDEEGAGPKGKEREREREIQYVTQPRTRPRIPMQVQKQRGRFSWGSSLKTPLEEGFREKSKSKDKGKGKEKEKVRPTSQVIKALRLKKISGPSPVQIEDPRDFLRDVNVDEDHFQSKGSVLEPGGSGSGKSQDEAGERDSMDGTWPRRPGSFPRLSFHPSSPSSPRGSPRENGMRGYF